MKFTLASQAAAMGTLKLLPQSLSTPCGVSVQRACGWECQWGAGVLGP